MLRYRGQSLVMVILFVGFVFLLGFSMRADGQWVWSPQTGRFINLKNLPKETAELQVGFARSQMLAGDHKRAWEETDKFIKFYSGSEYMDDNQYLRGEIRMAQQQYMDAANEFQQVVSGYPDSDLIDQVFMKQYEVGDRYYELGQAKLEKRWRFFRKKPLKNAAQVYGMVISNQPFTDVAAEAQYKVGLCQYTLEDYTAAAFEYRSVVERYSSSDWVDEARHGLAMCHDKSSLPPEYDQAPSELTIRAIDEFTALYPEDARNGELNQLRSEKRENIALQRLQTAQFYEKRRAYPSARIYYEIVTQEFADTQAAAEAQQWLASNPAASQ